MPYQHSVHPLKRVARRIYDMLLVDAPVEKICRKLEITERTLYKHYKHVLDQFPDRKAGRTAHEPTPESQNKVKMLSALGIPQEKIAMFMDMSVDSLHRHYRHELDKGGVEANLRVGANLFKMATGPSSEKNTAVAAIWWSKARMDWRDTSRIEQTGPDGGPLQVENKVVVVLPSNDRDNVIEGKADEAEECASLSLPEPDDGVKYVDADEPEE